MAVPIILGVIGRYLLKHGIKKATKKYGKAAVNKAKTNISDKYKPIKKITKKVTKSKKSIKQPTSLFGKTKRDKIASLIAAGVLITPPTLMGLAASRSKKKQEKDKLKKAADEHIKKGKKKQYKDRGGKGNK